MSLKELLVIHEENLHEEEEISKDESCNFYETKDHFRVERDEIKVLGIENFSYISINKKWREKGTYEIEENKIPHDANALFLVGKLKKGFYDYAMYCTVPQYVLDKTGMNDENDSQEIKEEDNLQEPKKKKKGPIFLWGMFFPLPVCDILNKIFK